VKETTMKSQSRTPHKARERASQEAGFTLVEALVAVIVLIFGLIAVTNLMIVAASSNSVANQSTAAAAVASQRLEILKQAPFDTMVVGGSVESDTTGFNEDVAVAGVGTIHCRWEVFPINLNPQALFITVRAEGLGALTGARSRAEFTTFRSCTAVSKGCPPLS